MMNLTMSHPPVPTFGDSFTITCYVCGMPSSKEWAQKARSRPTTPMKPYFPFLLQLQPLAGAVIREDGTTYLCAFCHASLEAQWNLYESQQVVPPPNRKYNIQKFICGVCAVETYRKRIRALPFQEFPFLEKQRQPGSITLGNNPLAIVCLDCSETLWAQSAEYDRWGLPVHKRHFNWMARPPPPEDSVEATVARLPSGETQLPRCPAIEPTMGPKSQSQDGLPSKSMESIIASSSGGPTTSQRVRGGNKGKGESPKSDNSSSPVPQMRKTSLTSTTPPTIDMLTAYQNQQPPVVTVAPMSATHSSIINVRKDSVTLPPVLIPTHPTGAPGIYPPPATAVYPPAASYAPYVWGSTSAGGRGEQAPRDLEAYSYNRSSQALHGAPPGGWSWLAHPASSELLRYPSYMSSIQSRTISESSASRSPTHATVSSPSTQPYRSGDSPVRYQPTVASAGGGSDVLTVTRQAVGEPRPTDSRTAIVGRRSPDHPHQHHKAGKKSPKMHTAEVSSLPVHNVSPARGKSDIERESSGALRRSSQPAERLSPLQSPPQSSSLSDDQDKVARREYHIPKKRNWQVFMKESQGGSGEDEKPQQEKVEQENIPHPKKKKPSFSSVNPPDIARIQMAGSSSRESEESKLSTKHIRGSPIRGGIPRSTDSAMDLTVSGALTSTPKSQAQSSKSTGANFRIEYLCQSESSTKTNEDEEDGANKQGDDSMKRTSVIKCAPKVPLATPDEDSPKLKMEAMDTVEEDNEDDPQSTSVSSAGADGATCDDSKDKIKKLSSDSMVEKPTAPEKDESESDDADIQNKRLGKDDGEEDKKKGKSERQNQASTLITDVDFDDERNNEDLRNIEQFLKETVTELLNREKEQEKMKREAKDKQTQFLHGLGLVTPNEKTELEIKSVVSRHERKTLPPIKLRADSNTKRRLDKQLKDLLLKVSLDDPTLFQEKPPAEDKCDFMAELGMKTAEKSDKTKREIKWRVILLERMRRELRDATARGVKQEWEKTEILKKFADCDLDSFFNSFSYASLEASKEEVNRSNENKQEEGTEIVVEGKMNVASGVCINYPKYIPSYASIKSEEGQDEESAKSVDEGVGDSVEAEASTSSGCNQAFAEPILKIPVLPTPVKKNQLSESSSVTTATSDIADDDELDLNSSTATDSDKSTSLVGEFIEKNLIGAEEKSSMDNSMKASPITSSSCPYPMRIDKLIQNSTNHWEQMKQDIDVILEELENTKEDIPQEEKTSHVERIRQHLRSQLLDIKGIEKRLRVTGKNILNASRKRVPKKD